MVKVVNVGDNARWGSTTHLSYEFSCGTLLSCTATILCVSPSFIRIYQTYVISAIYFLFKRLLKGCSKLEKKADQDKNPTSPFPLLRAHAAASSHYCNLIDDDPSP